MNYPFVQQQKKEHKNRGYPKINSQFWSWNTDAFFKETIKKFLFHMVFLLNIQDTHTWSFQLNLNNLPVTSQISISINLKNKITPKPFNY